MSMKFKVTARSFDDGAGTVYKKGQVVESDLDFTKKWANAFERVYVENGVPDAKAIEDAVEKRLAEMAATNPKLGELLKAQALAGVATTAPASGPKADPKALAARGADVTAKYPKVAAMPEGFKVFQRGDLFHVFVGDSLVPINEKGVHVAAVDAVVEKYLG